MIIADPVPGEANAWVLRPGPVVTEIELELLARPGNVVSLQRAIQETAAGSPGTDLT